MSNAAPTVPSVQNSTSNHHRTFLLTYEMFHRYHLHGRVFCGLFKMSPPHLYFLSPSLLYFYLQLLRLTTKYVILILLLLFLSNKVRACKGLSHTTVRRPERSPWLPSGCGAGAGSALTPAPRFATAASLTQSLLCTRARRCRADIPKILEAETGEELRTAREGGRERRAQAEAAAGTEARPWLESRGEERGPDRAGWARCAGSQTARDDSGRDPARARAARRAPKTRQIASRLHNSSPDRRFSEEVDRRERARRPGRLTT